MHATRKDTKNNVVPFLLSIIAFLVTFGAFEVYTASRFQAIELKGVDYYFGLIHLFWIILAVFAGFIAYIIPPGVWKAMAFPIYIVTTIALISVFWTPAVNGAHRWFEIGSFLTIQPSEFAKIALILFGAFILLKKDVNTYRNYEEYRKDFFVKTNAYALVMILLVSLQPDLGTAVVMAASFYGMYFIKDNKYKFRDLKLVLFAGLVLGTLAILIQPYRLNRVKTYIDFIATGEVQNRFEDGYQMWNILIGVGSGGVIGKGIGQSRQRYGYLAEVTAFTDSISAVIFEELGLILSVLFVGVYLAYFMLATVTIERLKDESVKLAIWGFALWFIVQSMFHFSVNVALIPVKGITLPFVSYGGTAMLGLAIGTGIMLRLHRS